MAFPDETLESLRETSRLLARSEEARSAFATGLDGRQDALRKVEQIWKQAVEAREPSGGMNEDGKLVEVSIVEAQDEQQLERAILCARILRNSAVGNRKVQELLFTLLPATVDVLWKCTSFSHASDIELQNLTRSLVQLLSNTITQNDSLQGQFWVDGLHISPEETVESDDSRTGADLFGRLVQSRDLGTSTAGVILLINCTLDSTERSESICQSRSGVKILRSTLTAIQEHMDKEDVGPEAEPELKGELPPGTTSSELTTSSTPRKPHESLEVFYNLFTNLFDRQLFGTMYDRLASPGSDDAFRPLVSHAQLTLLRFLDSYLHLGAITYGGKSLHDSTAEKDLRKLLKEFTRLASWAEEVMTKSIKEGTKEEIDSRLVDVHVALILLLQSLITIGLKTEETTGDGTIIKQACGTLLLEMRKVAFVQKLVSLLRTLAKFSPPVSPFQSATASSTQAQQPPEGHVFTSTGRANAAASIGTGGGPGLDNLKRDIINLLGVLSYERGSGDRSQVRQVQDTVRESGGLLEVLSLTQIDERNPYIRERAIFTLRALLQGNEQSQGLIAQLKPTTASATS